MAVGIFYQRFVPNAIVKSTGAEIAPLNGNYPQLLAIGIRESVTSEGTRTTAVRRILIKSGT
jgi:hypothetical protein